MVEPKTNADMPGLWATGLRLLCFCTAALWTVQGLAEGQKPEPKKPEPPAIAVVLPLGADAGSRQQLTLRGPNVPHAPTLPLTGLSPTLTGHIQ